MTSADRIKELRKKTGLSQSRFAAKFEIPVTADYTMFVVVVSDPTNYIQMTTDMENADVDAPDELDVDFFDDGLDGLVLFRSFVFAPQGLFLRFKKK